MIRPAILVLCLMWGVLPAFGQEPDAPRDSTETIYEKIERFSHKGKVWRWIHSTIFVPPEPEKPPPAPALPSRRVNPYDRYKGKVIRHVIIDVADPFGFTVEDTVQRQLNRLQHAGNMLHRKTRPVIVRNQLLVRPFDRLDPLKISESERVLRTSPAISDARIRLEDVGRDSVDVFVRVLDRWSIDVGADGDQSRGNVRVTEHNLLGLGHRLEQRASLDFEESHLSLQGRHQVYNIGNTYISSLAQYQMTPERDMAAFSMNRPFYSPLALWAGGASVNKTWIRVPVITNGVPTEQLNIDPVNTDTWLARSFPLERDGPESGRLSNIVVGARLALTRYDRRPSVEYDPFRAYHKNTLFLMGVGLSQRQYYKERYLFRFGLTEDVPEGLLLRFIGGLQKRENMVNMPYLGAELARGRNYGGFGYLNYEIGYGTFIGARQLFDATFRGGITYFSELVTLGRWHVRQFVRVQSVLGFAKPAFSRLNLNVDHMYGFESYQISGTHRTIFSFETVAYAPWDLIGFRIAPVMLMGFGILGEETDPWLSGQVMSSFTLGILIRNERLLMNTFEVALGFFPFVPEEDGPLWKHNAFTNFNIGTRGYDFTSPHVIGYH